ncbi:hypothetical protein UFOVP671_23 [uncultured Caudovirales phage]|uniref:Uncharacterized protein n=1 Tax=uncultured Caudovirales phage TaxID=2100421 RepID=A0A6J5NDW2_9CAUD|nr:hypothetical protein UFOVP671_23 [uncultured Caudovirales phage]
MSKMNTMTKMQQAAFLDNIRLLEKQGVKVKSIKISPALSVAFGNPGDPKNMIVIAGIIQSNVNTVDDVYKLFELSGMRVRNVKLVDNTKQSWF